MILQRVHHGHIAVDADEGQCHHGYSDETIVGGTLEVTHQVRHGGEVSGDGHQ